MLLLLALACGDKDTSDDKVVDTQVTTDDTDAPDDTGEDTGDSAEPNSCVIAEVSPLTVPVRTPETTVQVRVQCGRDLSLSDIVEVRIGGLVGSWSFDDDSAQDGSGFLTIDASGLEDTGVNAIELDLVRETLTTSVRAHTAEPEFLQPDGVYDLGEDWPGGLDLACLDSSPLFMSDDGLVLFDESGTAKTETPTSGLRGVCLRGKCFCVPGYRVVGNEGTSVVSADIEAGLSTYEATGEEVLDVGLSSRGALQVLQRTKTSLSVYQPETKKEYPLGELTGDLLLAEDSVFELSCKTNLIIEERRVSDAQVLQTEETSLPCSPDATTVALMDVDGDGKDEQVFSLTYGDSTTVAVRTAEGVTAVTEADSVIVGDGIVITTGPTGVFTKTLTSTGVESPLFIGNTHEPANPLAGMASTRPPDGIGAAHVLSQDGLARWMVVPTGSSEIAADADGNTLTRERSGDTIKWALNGSSVSVLDGGWWVGLYNGTPVSITTEDLVIDEREMSTGADWDFRVVGPADGDDVWVMALAEEGLQLSRIDLTDPEDPEVAGKLRKLKPLGAQGAMRERNIKAHGIRRAQTAAPVEGEELDAFEGELTESSLVVTMPWDTGTACPCATVLLPGVSTEPDDLIASAVVLAVGEEADCSDLAVPLASADLFADGGLSVVLSDGTAYRINELQIPEKVTMEQDGDFYARFEGGDFNGDGLGDGVFITSAGDRSLWLSAGDGTALESSSEAPAWTNAAESRGDAPDLTRPPTAIFPTSWAALLD